MTDYSDWTFPNDVNWDDTGAGQIVFNVDTQHDWNLPDQFIHWLPYKEEKYFPAWHLKRSYYLD